MQLCNFTSHITAKQRTNNLLAGLPNTVNSCRKHVMVAAKLTSEYCTSFRNIYSAGSTIIPSVIVDTVEMDTKPLLVHVQCLRTYQFACSPPSQHLASNLIFYDNFSSNSTKSISAEPLEGA
jgi:hypothetical protein